MEWQMEWQDEQAANASQRRLSGAAELGTSLRWWAKETSDGRLILRRSVLVRYSAMVVLVVGVFSMVYLGPPLMAPYSSGTDAEDTVFALVVLGVLVLWAINVLRRRTVLSEDGIAMRRLVFTERRPWTSVLSRFTLSTLDLTEPASHSGLIERTRIAIENGDSDDIIRLPGCVIGMTWGSSEDRAAAAIGDLQYYIGERGWTVSEDVASGEDPGLVEARGRHRADKLAHKVRLVFCTPVWRRLKEHLCNGGLFLIGLGVLFMVVGGQRLFFETGPVTGSDQTFAVIFLLLGLVTMAYPMYKICQCFQRVVVDDQGIRVGRRVCAWPQSRSGLFVAGDRIFVVCGSGQRLALDGAGVTWGSFRRRQEQLVARCEAMWLWGVARGATRETGRYVAVRRADIQEEREILERGMGLKVPR